MQRVRRGSTHLTLFERRHLLLHGDVLLLQLAVVLQRPGLSHFVLSDVIAQLTTLQLCQLGILNESKKGRLHHEKRHRLAEGNLPPPPRSARGKIILGSGVVTAGEMKSDVSAWSAYHRGERPWRDTAVREGWGQDSLTVGCQRQPQPRRFFVPLNSGPLHHLSCWFRSPPGGSHTPPPSHPIPTESKNFNSLTTSLTSNCCFGLYIQVHPFLYYS